MDVVEPISAVLPYIVTIASVIYTILRAVKLRDVGWVLLQTILKGKSKLVRVLLTQRAAGLANRIATVIEADLIDGQLDKLDKLEHFMDDLLRPATLGEIGG